MTTDELKKRTAYRSGCAMAALRAYRGGFHAEGSPECDLDDAGCVFCVDEYGDLVSDCGQEDEDARLLVLLELFGKEVLRDE